MKDLVKQACYDLSRSGWEREDRVLQLGMNVEDWDWGVQTSHSRSRKVAAVV